MKPQRSHASLRRWALICALWACIGVQAQGLQADDRAPIATALVFGHESLRLPASERLGLVGASLLFETDDGIWAGGPAVYGAASGQRGGLFVGGLEVRRNWPLGAGFALATGLYAGGGGGGAAPVGSGLMLRPALTLWRDVGPQSRLGLSWSAVRFPSGEIRSQQVGLALSLAGSFRQAMPGTGEAAAARGPSGLGFDRMAVTLSRYGLHDGSGRHIGLLGMRAEQDLSTEGFSWGLEAAAAAQGDAAGYMEILPTLAWAARPLPQALPALRVGARAALGLGGGGAVPTGGGLMGKLTASAEISPWPGASVGLEAGVLRAGSLRADIVQARLGIELETRPARSGNDATTRMDWTGSLQHHSNELRSDGSRRSLDTVGLAINRYLGEHLYLSGQAHSAFAGGAGAYSVGLLGLGASSGLAPWRGGAELLLGAAGGGGVATGGGAIAQFMAWAGWSASPGSEWRLGAGKRLSLHGGSGSPLVEVTWSRSFSVWR